MPTRNWTVCCGAGMRPPSVATTVIGLLLLSCSRRPRESEALRMRNRYLRLATFKVGQGGPLTRITSP